DDTRVRVPERVHPNSSEEIEVAAAVRVVQVAALTAREDQRISGVSLQKVVPLQVHDCLGRALHEWGQGACHSLMIAESSRWPLLGAWVDEGAVRVIVKGNEPVIEGGNLPAVRTPR